MQHELLHQLCAGTLSSRDVNFLRVMQQCCVLGTHTTPAPVLVMRAEQW